MVRATRELLGGVQFIGRTDPDPVEAAANAAFLDRKQRDADSLVASWNQLLEEHLGELVGAFDGVLYTGASVAELKGKLAAVGAEWGDAVIMFVQHERLVLVLRG